MEQSSTDEEDNDDEDEDMGELAVETCGTATKPTDKLQKVMPLEVEHLSRRQHIENEIVSTEEKYVDALQYLGAEYEQPLRRLAAGGSGGNAGIFTLEELDLIFSSANLIRNFNESMLLDFHRSRHAVQTKGCADGNYTYDQSLASIIKTRAPFMKIYTSYLQEMDERLAIVKRRLQKAKRSGGVAGDPNTNLEAFERSKRMRLEALLIQPVQRLPRYKLLLADLLKATPPTHGDYEEITEALDLVAESAGHCNAFLNEVQSHNQAWNLHEELGKSLGLEYCSHRRLLKRGPAGKRNRRGRIQPLELFLFTDVLVYGDKIAGVFRTRRRIPLYPAGTITCTFGATNSQIIILSRVRSFVLDFHGDEDAAEWFHALQDALGQNSPNGQLHQQNSTIAKALSSRASVAVAKFQSHRVRTAPDDDAMKLVNAASSFLDNVPIQQRRASLMPPTAGNTERTEYQPLWVPNTTRCSICGQPFSLFHRPHHCRFCGKCVCGACSHSRAPASSDDASHSISPGRSRAEMVRICDECTTSSPSYAADRHGKQSSPLASSENDIGLATSTPIPSMPPSTGSAELNLDRPPAPPPPPLPTRLSSRRSQNISTTVRAELSQLAKERGGVPRQNLRPMTDHGGMRGTASPTSDDTVGESGDWTVSPSRRRIVSKLKPPSQFVSVTISSTQAKNSPAHGYPTERRRLSQQGYDLLQQFGGKRRSSRNTTSSGLFLEPNASP
eukprot:INCI6223.15.p1 GENE.INCI6223.15~~INCI6223.15.p1  ORF type:complete len:728 (-),score=112.67 INCI6223.15:2287-4470(-)